MSTVSVLLARKGHQVHRVPPDATLAAAAREMRRHRVGALVVADAAGDAPLQRDAVAGLVSERDVVTALAERGFDPRNEVRSVATSELHWATPDMSVAELAHEMTSRRIRHLPVCDGRLVVGVVSIGDAVAWHLAQLSADNEALVRYVSTGRG